MYVIGDVCYAGTLIEGIKVKEVRPMEGRIMLVTFSTGETRIFDTTVLKGAAFDELDDAEVFNNPVIFHGVITWKDGEIDIAPEAVYQHSYAYEKDIGA